MPLQLKCYIDAGGQDVMQAWYAAQDETIRGEFVGILEILTYSARALSDPKLFKPLTKRSSSKCVGLTEILIDRDGRHYRVLGVCGPGVADFTMLFAFCKNDNPRYAEPCRVSLKRKAEVERDHGRSHNCEFPPIDEN